MTTMNFTELDISAIAVGAGRTLTTATLSNITLDGRRLEQRFRMDAGRCPFGSGKWHKPQVHCDGATADKWRALDRLVLGAVSARGDQDRFAYKNALREDETYGPSVEFKIDPDACRVWRLVDGNRTAASLDDLKGSTVVTIFRIAFLSQYRNNGGQSKLKLVADSFLILPEGDAAGAPAHAVPVDDFGEYEPSSSKRRFEGVSAPTKKQKCGGHTETKHAPETKGE